MVKRPTWYLVAGGVLALLVASFGVPVPDILAQNNWYAEYFVNRDLSGGPVLTRYEDKLAFEWGSGSPGTGIPADNFSARWTRDAWFENGAYRFSYRSDDGVRIWVGDLLVVDDWRDRQANWSFVDRVIPRGTQRVRVEYYEHGGGAALEVKWELLSGGSAWRAEYFDNRNLSGAPVLVRYDPAVDFDWGTGSPDSAVPADNFSVRWTHTLGFTPGAYRFYASCDDGVRVYVDGSRVVDAWYDQKLPNTRWGDITLGSGQHTVVVEYYEHGDKASAHVWWDLRQAFAGWEGRYYDNPDLRGGPALIRDDTAIAFDWGEGAPADWMPTDNFSVAWTRQVNFAAGTYRFNVQSDDGVRVWLDGGLLMDYWQPQEYALRFADNLQLQGLHTIRVEYFERAGYARVRFWWESGGAAPSPTPIPTQPIQMPGPWQGEYFNDRDLGGVPVLKRSDAALDFNWGWESPGVSVNRDDFSARWSGSFFFEQGRYTFTTYSDDGVRVYVDGKRVIDSWRPMRGYRRATLDLTRGTHAVQVEYFERGGIALIRFWWSSGAGAGVPAPQPTVGPAPATCAGGPLRLDAWPVSKTCTATGWAATIFVEGHGGDCRYTYAWERQPRSGQMPGATTFEVRSASRGSAIVGEASVTSAGQAVVVGLYVPAPKCP